MPIRFTITAAGKTSRPLLTLIPDIPNISLIKTISPSMKMEFLSASWAYICTKMGMRLPNTAPNTGVQSPAGNRAVSVNIPAPRLSTAEPYISSLRIIQDCLTYRQGTAKHGKRNITEELPWNAPISVRKRTID